MLSYSICQRNYTVPIQFSNNFRTFIVSVLETLLWHREMLFMPVVLECRGTETDCAGTETQQVWPLQFPLDTRTQSLSLGMWMP